MPKSLFATFSSSDTFSQHIYGEFATHLPTVLEAVSNSLRLAVDTNSHSIDFRIEDSLCESLAGESDEAQPQAIDHGLFCFKVDGHPNRGGIKGKKAMEPDCGLKANDAFGYALARKNYLALKGLRTNPYRHKAPDRFSEGVHAAGLCLALLDVFHTDTDLSRAQQSVCRQSKASGS